MAAPRFTDDTLKFLRSLKRHNERVWFQARRDQYDRHVRDRMLAVIERLAHDLPSFAPELVASPRVSMYRIYRDTRFSPDKTPYKTHVAAVFPHRALPKHGGAGLYFHVGPDEVFVGAGIYAPEPRQLYQVREHLSKNLTRFRTIVESPTFRQSSGELSGQRLKRVPKGFDTEDPAGEYLKFKQFLAGTGRPSTFSTSVRFYSSLTRLFKRLAPFVRFLNEPLTDPNGRNTSRSLSV